MELLVDQGRYELETPPEELKRQMLVIERKARICYQSEVGPITDESAAKLVRYLLHNRGHISVIDHGWLSVNFFGESRGMTHELVRHRLAAYSQESTRYVDYAKSDKPNAADIVDLDRFSLKMVMPPHRNLNDKKVIKTSFAEYEWDSKQCAEIEEAIYRGHRKSGWKPEDARQFLPIGTESNIGMSCSFTEWRHVMTMRTGKPAHWEIRAIMCRLLKELKTIIPVLFEDFQEVGIDSNGVPYYEKSKIEK